MPRAWCSRCSFAAVPHTLHSTVVQNHHGAATSLSCSIALTALLCVVLSALYSIVDFSPVDPATADALRHAVRCSRPRIRDTRNVLRRTCLMFAGLAH